MRCVRALAGLYLISLVMLPMALAEDDIFATDAKPSFRKLAPEPGTDIEYYAAEDVQPDITIRREEHADFEEYSVNGNPYMIKVSPKVGSPYYLMDSDGNGEFGWRRGNMNNDLLVPGWAVFSW